MKNRLRDKMLARFGAILEKHTAVGVCGAREA